MESPAAKNGRPRLEALRDILIQQRSVLLTRIKDLRRSQAEEKATEPSDDLDVARSHADVETHASLLDHSESLLKAIDSAATRLEKGQYGICEECGTDIPVNRLEALPFAAYCVECQRESETRRQRGTVSESFMRRWEVPEEMSASLERQDSHVDPEDRLTIHNGNAFGPEDSEPLEPLGAMPDASPQYRKLG